MPKRRAFADFLLAGVAIICSSGCAFIQYDKGAGPPADPTTQQSPSAVPASARQNALSSLAVQAGGPGGGWIIAATARQIEQHSLGTAQQADRLAAQHPAGPGDIQHSDNCDLNADGYVTMDEVLALKRAGLNDDQLISRVRHTPQVFCLTDRQQQYLRDRGISQTAIDVMLSISGQPGTNY